VLDRAFACFDRLREVPAISERRREHAPRLREADVVAELLEDANRLLRDRFGLPPTNLRFVRAAPRRLLQRAVELVAPVARRACGLQ
jgi:hypothetical protein